MIIFTTLKDIPNECLEMKGIREAISESLMKLIQQRYGMSTFYVFTPEDFLYINIPEVGVSIPGLFALDNDLALYRNMLPMDPGDMYE